MPVGVVKNMGISMKNSALFALACASLVVAGCGEKQPTVAHVNERAITEAAFEGYLKHKRIPLKDEKKVEAALDQYLTREAMAQAVTDAGLLDKARVEAEVNEFKKQLLISRYFEQFLTESVPEQALLNYYNTHKEAYASRQIHLAHILIKVRAKAGEGEQLAAQSRAREALSMLGRGKTFEEVAEQYSHDDRTAKKGGDLGWVAQGAVNANFSRVAFSTPAGSVSEPVKSQMGYHLIKVLEPAQTVQKPYDAVKGEIRYQLRQQAKAAEEKRLAGSVTVTKTTAKP